VIGSDGKLDKAYAIKGREDGAGDRRNWAGLLIAKLGQLSREEATSQGCGPLNALR
jgi:hypothetical protein